MSTAWTDGIVWQSTLLLGLGVLASLAHKRRPAHGHHALLLAACMTLALPVLALGVSALGWGLLPATSEPSHGVAMAPVADGADAHDPFPAMMPAAPVVDGSTSATTAGHAGPNNPSTKPGSGPDRRPAVSFDVPWKRVLLGAWGALTLLATLRLAWSWRRARHLVAQARPSSEDALLGALERAARGVGLVRLPRLVVSEAVSSPLLWPWAKDGVVLLPTDAAARRRVDWQAVFAHELAHLRRRDHCSRLIANLLVALLPWQPLAWWCRRQSTRLAELACDDWVIAAGHARADYADALLAFAPMRGQLWAEAAVSNGSRLRERIRRILEHGRAAPLIGRGWRNAAAALAVIVAVVVACTQPGGVRSESPNPVNGGAPPASGTISGTVVDASGKTVAGAIVRAATDGDDSEVYTLRQTARTDERGNFRFERLDLSGWWSFSVDDPRYARQWIGEIRRDLAKDSATPLRLAVQEPRELSGIVRNEEDQPIAGVRVTVTREYLEDPHKPLQGHENQDLAVTTTDATGHFALDRLRPGWVTLMLDHSDYARSFSPGDPRLATGQAGVELVIAYGCTLHGRVVSRGQPVAGVAIKASTPNLSHRPIGEWDVRTDADGRFQLRGVSTMLSRTRSAPAFMLVALSVDDRRWASAEYRVYDEGKPELPVVEIEAEPRDQKGTAATTAPIDVNWPKTGFFWRSSGEPMGKASLHVLVEGLLPPARNERARELWLDGTSNGGESLSSHSALDEAGAFEFNLLPAGSYSLWCPPLGQPNYPTLAVTLAEGESRELVMYPGPARVHGQLTCGGVPVTQGRIDVNIWQSGPAVGFLQGYGAISPDGAWEASGLPMGRYRITYDNGEGGHSVPNYFIVNLTKPDTPLDLALPQTRIDFTLRGREAKPADYDQLRARDMDIRYWIQVYPGGDAPMGGNTAGLIDVADGALYAEHLPPGRWTLKTTSTDGRELVARVVLATDTSRIAAELVPTDSGSASLQGALSGLDLTQFPEGQLPVRIDAFPKDDAGLDVTASFGSLTVEGNRYRLSGLPAGRYGILVGPADERTAGVPYVYLPDVRVGEGETLTRDIALSVPRDIGISTRNESGDAPHGSWRIDMGGGDWLPCHIFVGSEPRGLIGFNSRFPVAVGGYRVELTFRGEAPQVRTIRVEPGTGVQQFDFVYGADH